MKPLTARKITSWVLIITLVGLVVWDIVAFAFGGAQATESVVLKDWATTHPSIAFGLGTIAGHWFWNVDEVRHPQLMWTALVLLAVLLVVDLIFGLIPAMYPLFPFGAGVITGRVLWPLEKKVEE